MKIELYPEEELYVTKVFDSSKPVGESVVLGYVVAIRGKKRLGNPYNPAWIRPRVRGLRETLLLKGLDMSFKPLPFDTEEEAKEALATLEPKQVKSPQPFRVEARNAEIERIMEEVQLSHQKQQEVLAGLS